MIKLLRLLLVLVISGITAPVMADVAIVGTPGLVTAGGSRTAETGSSRAEVITICRRGPTANNNNPQITSISWGLATLAGGQIVQAGTAVESSGNGKVRCYVYYVLEANIPSGSQTTAVVWSETMAGASSLLTFYTLSGVNQTTPIDGSVQTLDAAVATNPFTLAMSAASGSVQIVSSAIHATGANNPAAPFTERRDTTDTDYRHWSDSNANASSGTVTWTRTFSGTQQGSAVYASFARAVASPTFTSAPAIGTRTTSTIPINFTSDTTGTVYGGRLTDGSGAPTCDQLEATTATGGLTYFSEAVVATVADSHSFTSLTDGTVVDGYFCIEDGSGNDSAVASIADMYKLPAFTTALTVASQTDVAYTSNSKVLDGPGVVDLVACAKDASPPTVSQVEARTGGCIVNGSTDDATGAQTLTITGSISAVYDLYYVGSYGSQHEAAVNALVDKCLAAATGYQQIGCPNGITSIAADSFCALLNVSITPDIAIGDIPTLSLVTSPDSYVLTTALDCSLSYPGSGARQSFVLSKVDDVSAGGNMSGGPTTLYLNNEPPVFSPPSFTASYAINVAIDAIDLCAFASDPEGDVLTGSISVGALPTGLVIGGTNNCTLSGTPTLEDEAGDESTFTATDIASDTGDLLLTLYVINTVTEPNCVGGTQAACEALLDALHADITLDTVTYQCGLAADAGEIISQNPAAATELHMSDTVDLVVSKRCVRGGYKVNYGMGYGIH